MKTEPTEAGDMLYKFVEMRGWNKNKLIGWSEAADFADWFANQSSPKIKQLEWEEPIIEEDGSEWIESHYIFGQFYEIENCSNHYFILYMVDGTETTHLSLNEAKAAAQEHFEKRIKECLE